MAVDPLLYGQQLRHARESRALNILEVARELHLLQSVITAMEQGDKPASVPVTFWRGYLRAYASFLQVPIEPLLRDLPNEVPHIESGYREEQLSSRHIWPITWVIVAVLTLLVLLWWQDNRQPIELEVASVPAADSSAVSAEVTQTGVVAEVEPRVEVETASETTEPANADTSSTATRSTEPENAMGSAVEAVLSPSSPAVAAELLQMTFNGSCWLKVVDAQSKLLFQGTRSREQSLELRGVLPYRLTLGNPQAISLVLGGQSVDLSRYPRGRVARLTLGD